MRKLLESNNDDANRVASMWVKEANNKCGSVTIYAVGALEPEEYFTNYKDACVHFVKILRNMK